MSTRMSALLITTDCGLVHSLDGFYIFATFYVAKTLHIVFGGPPFRMPARTPTALSVSWFYFVPQTYSGQLGSVTTASFPVTSISLRVRYPALRRYIIRYTVSVVK
jgi:hypothetical protein